MSEPIITLIYPIIRKDYIYKSLQTLNEYTIRDKYKVIIIDQTIDGLDSDLSNPYLNGYVDMVIRVKNQGFSGAINLGIIHALRWNTPYIGIVNDDVEFIYYGWLEDTLSEFDTDPRIIAVNPECPKVAGWGYGLDNSQYIEILPYKEKYSKEDIEYLKKGDYDGEEIQSRHAFEIPKSFPLTKRGVVDGFAGWLPIFKREGLIQLGLYDERFVWGSGEDYDMLARAYSCAWPIDRKECEGDDSPSHLRMVSTMKSWCYHHWGKSKNEASNLSPELFRHKESWNNLSELWPQDLNEGHPFDVWAHYTDEQGKRKPLRRIKSIKVNIP